jgi:hypothetical protein
LKGLSEVFNCDGWKKMKITEDDVKIELIYQFNEQDPENSLSENDKKTIT